MFLSLLQLYCTHYRLYRVFLFLRSCINIKSTMSEAFLSLLCAQVFAYLERWCAKHNLAGDHAKKVAPIHLIFVVDGRIDACKLSRNENHERRQLELRQLRQKVTADQCLPADVERFKKLQRKATRPNGQLVADLVAWITTKPYCTVFGAPW